MEVLYMQGLQVRITFVGYVPAMNYVAAPASGGLEED